MTATRLNYRSPWVIDTRALGLDRRRGPGSSRPLALTAPAAADTGTAVLAVPEGSDVQVSGLLESVAEGVLVSGLATATATGSCARCLRDIAVPVSTEFRELYAYPESTTAATTDDDEVPRLADDRIDLEPLVHDELVLAMPLAPVCAPDCSGLCPDCGERLDELGPEHRHDTLDPRWAALAGLLDADTTMDQPTGDDAGTAPAGATGGSTVTGTSADDIEEK